MRCMDDEEALALFERRLSPEETAAIEHHADSCAACRMLMAHVARVWTSPASDMPSPADLRSADSDVHAGTRLGRYVVGKLIGEGGMGVVYEAYDPALDRTVALKLLRPEVLASERGTLARERLIREARAMARISHPNVLHVYDVCVVDERVTFAMELVSGTTLRGFLTTSRTFRETPKRSAFPVGM